MAFISFVLLSMSLLRGGISQRYKWECSSLDATNDHVYLPDLEEIDERGVARVAYWLIQSAPATYIYPINGSELNCSGIVTDVEYCYNCLRQNLDIETTVFTISTLAQDGTKFTVIDTIDIRTTPTNENCTGRYTKSCCEITTLSPEEQFELSPQNFAYAVTVPPRSVNLLGWGRFYYPQYYVGLYKTSVVPTVGHVYTFNTTTTNAAHRIMKFHILPSESNPTTITKMTFTGKVTTGAQSSGINKGLIGGVVGGVIAPVLVVLAVIFVVVIIKKRSLLTIWNSRGRGYFGLKFADPVDSGDDSPIISDEENGNN